MQYELDARRRIIGVETVSSTGGYTITCRRNLDLETQVLTARHLYLSNLETSYAESQCHA